MKWNEWVFMPPLCTYRLKIGWKRLPAILNLYSTPPPPPYSITYLRRPTIDQIPAGMPAGDFKYRDVRVGYI